MTQPYVVGDSSPFLKRVLIPFWVVRIIIMCINIIIYGLIVVALSAYRSDIDRELRKEYNMSINFGTAIGISVAICIIIIICLILDLVSIIKRARRTLSPKFFLFTNIFQTFIWTILFVLSMIGARTGATIAVGVIVYLSFFGMLIYSAIIFHKYRKGTLGGGASGGVYKPTQQNDVHNFDPNTTYGHPAQQYPTAPYAPQDYSYGGAAKVHEQQQQPQYGQQAYGQQPQYGYGHQGGESHEMHHQRV